ncbi:hypothetical protein [Peptoniphilus sp. EMRHCC_23]|uniref:hypothetical protein n=1 Tax=Peptoniphilus rachelemmaiella TaxID=2811779 RepID=UPI001C003A85|nr:hypothetical protein [Peptoniphilus rachelemmaiella]
MENDLRRFRVITDDPEKEKRLFRLISEKGLSRDDLYLLLTGLGLNFDIYPESNDKDLSAASGWSLKDLEGLFIKKGLARTESVKDELD